ncbi:MAG: HesA/MoeB/ThiF family protein [Myxococcales bacterium]|nr:HesA/MoeB/ThiF family protein [Myxococcales bacterium]
MSASGPRIATSMPSGQVLIVGAGGLGCGAVLALAAAGIETLTVLDDDVVDESNLHRQVLHRDEFVGRPKVESLTATLARRFPATKVRGLETRLTVDNALSLFTAHQVILDGSDNLETKFLVNDAAVLAGRPLVHGAAVGTMGQLVTVPAGGRPCYRCLFEDLPPQGAEAVSCNEAGVLGPVPGVIGALQAHEAIRLLCGKTPAFSGRLVRYDSPAMTMRSITFRPNPTCGVCGEAPPVPITQLDAGAYGPSACRSETHRED